MEEEKSQAQEFNHQVSKVVKEEALNTFASLDDEDITVGKIQIRKTRNKIVDRIIKGDKGRLKYSPEVEIKIRSYVKKYIIRHYITKPNRNI